MPDGGGIRLTAAEYLTPALQHGMKDRNARYDRYDRRRYKTDIQCSSSRGIPSDIGADVRVGIAVDARECVDEDWQRNLSSGQQLDRGS
jgi:hypothetical protein